MESKMSVPFQKCLLATCVMLSAAYSASGEDGSRQRLLVVVNQGDHNISLIDTTAGKQVATVDVVGVTGHEAVVSPDGRTAYVPIYGNSGVGRKGTDGDQIVVVDLPSRKVTGAIQFDHGVRPHCILFDQHTGMLMVTTELDEDITIIDPATLKIVGTIPTSQAQSHMFALSHDGRTGYTANVGPGTVSVLDIAKRKTVAIIPISADTQRISISNDDSLVFTSDQTRPQLAVIDTATRKVRQWISLPGLGYGTAPTRDGRWLLVAMRTRNEVAVIDLATFTVVKTVSTPAAPTEILLSQDGKAAYVSCPPAGQVAMIDLTNWSVAKVMNAGKNADGLAGAP